MILMSSEPNGSVSISIESIVQLAQRTAQSNREVRSMSCRVRVRGALTRSMRRPIRCTGLNLSLRGAPAHPELIEGRGGLDEVEHTSANLHCCDDEIATLRSQ